jgi:hypothetical protein
LFLNALVDGSAGLPVGIVATVRHDWREIKMDVVGSSVARCPAHHKDIKWKWKWKWIDV